MTGPRITPVILSGGSGSRLWPLSTAATPKQFLGLTGDATMLQLTVLRTAGNDRFGQPVIVAADAHRRTIESQLAEAGVAPFGLILEPCARGTAPAAALAALAADPAELLLLMPSDHLIRAPDRLLSAIEAARPLVVDGWLTTFGVAATRAETGYGWIKRGDEIAPGVHRAERFVEKPGRDAAERMLAGGHDWNAGIFLFAAGAFLDALGRHAPDILDCARRAMAGRTRGPGYIRPDADAFGRCRNESIDRAVMEKAERIAVVPVDIGWSDIGSWDSLYEAGAKDDEGNSASGPATLVDTRSCLVRSEGPRIVAVGVEDLIVVATADAVLVVPRGRSQRVREAVERLPPPDEAAGD